MVEWIVFQFLSYPLLCWLLFVGVALLASYFGGYVGIVVGCFLVAFAVLLLDIGYATTHEYMDMDIVFTIGVVFRAVLINGVLLPVSALGFFLKRRRKSRSKRIDEAHASAERSNGA
jgi:O-antigen ligase